MKPTNTHWRLLLLTSLALLVGGSVSAQSRSERLTQGRPELAKLSGHLLAARRAEIGGESFVEAMRQRTRGAVRDDRVQAILSVEAFGPELRSAVLAAGMTIVSEVEAHGLRHLVVRCTSAQELVAVATRSDVRMILEEPAAKTNTGSVTNQADGSMMSDDLRTTMGVDGSGIEVGVLSDTFHRTLGGTLTGTTLTGSTPQTTGDLPSSVEVLDPGPTSGTDEGAAMAELIFDVAPGSDISFASAFTSYLTFATNITALVTAGADVVVDDVIYFAEPMFQDGPIALSAEAAVDAGVPYYSSAGNSAANAVASAFVDIDSGSDDAVSFPSTGVDLHDFGGGDAFLTFTLVSGGSILAQLHWDQPYGGGLAVGPGSAADLDLYVTSSTSLPLTSPGNVVAVSASIQGTIASPSGDAYETVGYTNTSGGTQTLHLAIDRFYDAGAITPSRMQVTFFQLDGSFVDAGFIGARTIYGHSAADGAQAVGAMYYAEIDANGAVDGGPELNVEAFSSLGGNLPFVFDGTGAPMSEELRFKPEITAPDGSDTTFFIPGLDIDGSGNPDFFGTSAAAPHAAAVAALLLDLNPGWSPDQVNSVLQSSARDAEVAGFDFLSGAGLIDALAAGAPGELRTWVHFLHVGTERGTPVNPFDSLVEGATAAGGGTVALRAGQSSDGSDTFPLTIDSAVVLTAEGGPVTIGD